MRLPVDEYVDKQKDGQKVIYKDFRKFLKKLLPNAEEYIGYGVPALKQNGKSIYYAVFKKHLGFYPGAEIIERFKEELDGFETAKGTVRFDLAKPIPYELVERMIKDKYLLD